MTDRVQEIRARLKGVQGYPWKYNPKCPMFVGTTNALDMYSRTLDLGRDMKEWTPDETGAYRLTKRCIDNMAQIRALGEFLEHCREDIEYLLGSLPYENVGDGI